MKCSLCGGLVTWRGPLSDLTHTECERCGGRNCQEPEWPEPDGSEHADGVSGPVETLDEQGCNCRWKGGVITQRCELHEAWHTAIHEWAERARTAEGKLAALPPVTAPAPLVTGAAWSWTGHDPKDDAIGVRVEHEPIGYATKADFHAALDACPECGGAGEFESALHCEKCSVCGGTGKRTSGVAVPLKDQR